MKERNITNRKDENQIQVIIKLTCWDKKIVWKGKKNLMIRKLGEGGGGGRGDGVRIFFTASCIDTIFSFSFPFTMDQCNSSKYKSRDETGNI